MSEEILGLINPAVLALDPYSVAIPAHTIKLNQNESPYDLPVAIKEALVKRLRDRVWSRYPSQIPAELRAELKKTLKLPAGIDVVVGNGSNELIQGLFLASLKRGTKVLIPVPTFSLYRLIATVLGVTVIEVPLRDDLAFDTDRILEEARTQGARVIILCRPNNPTGSVIPLTGVDRLARRLNALLVIDEAYHDFSSDSVLPLLADHENILSLRTFSKALCAAGLRIGYLLGQAALVTQVAKVMLPFNVSIMAREAALAILQNRTLLECGIRAIIADRERLYQALEAIEGVTPFPSQANFICFRTAKPAKSVFAALIERGILVRDVSHYPLLSDCLRVSVGRPEENKAFINAVREIMEGR